MKQIYRVPFERKSDRVKELWYQYVHVSQSLVVHQDNLFTITISSGSRNVLVSVPTSPDF